MNDEINIIMKNIFFLSKNKNKFNVGSRSGYNKKEINRSIVGRKVM